MADDGVWRWEFRGFETLHGNCLVQEWFDNLSDDAQDEARDIITYLQHLSINLWKRPEFSPLEDGLSEIRFKQIVEYRIYGFFGPIRRSYIFLHGTEKKVSNDRQGKRIAKERLDQINRNEARTRKFKF